MLQPSIFASEAKQRWVTAIAKHLIKIRIRKLPRKSPGEINFYSVRISNWQQTYKRKKMKKSEKQTPKYHILKLIHSEI